ncbi:MAG: hypothetical protein R3E32_18195 [Chitinophagales bacterium]
MKQLNKLTILGLSELTLSMIFEIIHHSYAHPIDIQIIRNLPYTPNFPFTTANANYSIVLDEDVDYTKVQHCSLGVFGTNTKKLIFEHFQKNYGIDKTRYLNLIYPDAVLASTITMGTGIHINPNVVIAPQTHIGDFVSINRSVSIGHHTHIGDFCTFNPASNVAGKCRIGEGVTLGIGCNVIDGISIGENTVVGAGSLVTKNLPANVVAYGVPAKVVRTLKDGL